MPEPFSRRTFLKGGVALGALAALPPVFHDMPRELGDNGDEDHNDGTILAIAAWGMRDLTTIQLRGQPTGTVIAQWTAKDNLLWVPLPGSRIVVPDPHLTFIPISAGTQAIVVTSTDGEVGVWHWGTQGLAIVDGEWTWREE